MTIKFGRQYRISIDPKDGGPVIIITLPFTIRFWVQRNTYSDLNNLTIDIYNLSEANRNRIFQDRYDIGVPNPNVPAGIVGREITFEAGYSTLYQIYSGTIFQASSARENNDIVTRIEAMSGNFDVATTQTFQTISGDQTLGKVFETLIGEFPNLKVGAIGDFSTTRPRPWVINGNVYDWLKQNSDQGVFVDNGKVYVLKPAETLADQVILFNDSSGLLETPRRDDGFLSITTLLEAGVNVGQQVAISSRIQTAYNGQYKVAGIQHHGTISSAISGTCRSVFGLVAATFFKQGLTKVAAS